MWGKNMFSFFLRSIVKFKKKLSSSSIPKKNFNSLSATFLPLSLSLSNKQHKNIKNNTLNPFKDFFCLGIQIFEKGPFQKMLVKNVIFQRYKFSLLPKYSLYQILTLQNLKNMILKKKLSGGIF